MSQFARCPLVGRQAGIFGDPAEGPADICSIQLGARLGGEQKVGVSPALPRIQTVRPLPSLANLVHLERVDTPLGSARPRQDFRVLVSPPARTDRHTMM